ncbi:hypothetical protein K438DRAFT_1785456 [Mycena galopus ATCC 62051]|nr:hypothetical protein K438DRAFT_1785456 [Mycena galopus ATCC 62051]
MHFDSLGRGSYANRWRSKVWAWKRGKWNRNFGHHQMKATSRMQSDVERSRRQYWSSQRRDRTGESSAVWTKLSEHPSITSEGRCKDESGEDKDGEVFEAESGDNVAGDDVEGDEVEGDDFEGDDVEGDNVEGDDAEGDGLNDPGWRKGVGVEAIRGVCRLRKRRMFLRWVVAQCGVVLKARVVNSSPNWHRDAPKCNSTDAGVDRASQSNYSSEPEGEMPLKKSAHP